MHIHRYRFPSLQLEEGLMKTKQIRLKKLLQVKAG